MRGVRHDRRRRSMIGGGIVAGRVILSGRAGGDGAAPGVILSGRAGGESAAADGIGRPA